MTLGSDSCSNDLASWVEAVRGGDEGAAQSLFDHLHPLVVKIVRAHLPRRSCAEDLVQMVFLKVFNRLNQYSGRVPLTHWVSRIAVNTCINQLDHERVRPELRWSDFNEAEEEALRALVSSWPGFETGQETKSRDIVDSLLRKLDAPDRLVLDLIYLENKSVEEVRQITGWSASLVKVRAFRARQKLKQHRNLLFEGVE
jgi:RNA polymerase sigma-70 factor (ECF subfamily)